MRLARVGQEGQEVGVVVSDDDRAYFIGKEIDAAFLANGGLLETREQLDAGRLAEVDISGMRFGPPIAQPTLLICIGLNYRQHAHETGADIPAEPVVFMKSPRTVIGPMDNVVLPRDSTTTDWEVELAIVIGRRTHQLASPKSAVGHIAGYAISNDISERHYQLERGGQWTKGKSSETFNPFGPYLVTPDEVDPGNLNLKLSVNGHQRQSANTSDMIFSVSQIVWYVSQFMVLDAGDVINTGTPAGVALGDPNPVYLQSGDRMEVLIDGLGRQEQTVRQQ